MSAKGLDTRRQNWARKQWRTSEHGNAFTNCRGFNLTVFRTRRGWGIRIAQRYGDRQQWGKRRYATAALAQHAAFDALLWAERQWHGEDLPAITNDASRTTP